MKPRVLIVEDITEPGKQFLRENGYDLIISSDTSVEAIKRDIECCDAVLSKTILLTREILESAKNLKVIGKHGAGIDNVVNINDANELGIYVVNTPYANSKSVAEFTIGFIIALAKNFIVMNSAVKNGDFYIAERVHGVELSGKKLGLIGLGNIGKLVAKKAFHGLEMQVFAYDPHVSPAQFPEDIIRVEDVDEIYKGCDFISLHLPATKETVGSVDYRKLALMKRGAYLINCARGSIIVEADLIRALKENLIAGFATDVYATEPPAPDNPLFSMDNVIHTPHCAALSHEALDNMGYGAALGIHEILSGQQATWCVNSNRISR